MIHWRAFSKLYGRWNGRTTSPMTALSSLRKPSGNCKAGDGADIGEQKPQYLGAYLCASRCSGRRPVWLSLLPLDKITSPLRLTDVRISLYLRGFPPCLISCTLFSILPPIPLFRPLGSSRFSRVLLISAGPINNPNRNAPRLTW